MSSPRMTGKVHAVLPEQIPLLEAGQVQTALCGVTVVRVAQVTVDLSTVSPSLRCYRCTKTHGQGARSDRHKLRSIERLALAAVDGTVSARTILDIIQG